MTLELRLDSEVAVVTGVAGKLGPLFASALHRAGAAVVGIDLEPDNLPAGGQADSPVLTLQADVTDRGALEAARDYVIAELGEPSILVNGAGVDQPPDAAVASYRLEEFPLNDFSRTFEVNVSGTFAAMQVFGQRMVMTGRGSIINIGSLYGTLTPEPSLYEHMRIDPPFLKPPAYGASKAAVVSLTRYFARLWGPHGVRVNVLAPGGVRGEQDAEFVAKYSERVPLGRMADPSELEGPLLFLASDASSYLTGHELRLDGGFTT